MNTPPDSIAPCVFVADDSPVARLAVVRLLRAEGCRVVEASSAAEMLEAAARETNVTCALLDLDLGDANGNDLAEALEGAHPGLPIAFFSATTSDAIAEGARAKGPLFSKPDALNDAIAWVKARIASTNARD